MKVDIVVVGTLETNCYILSIGNECILIDPGDEYDKIKNVIRNNKVLGAIVTHRHFDHIGALSHFENVYDRNNLKEGQNDIGPFTFEIIYTPGHTDDSICIYFKDDNIIFDGDFIFKNGIGRTDLGGNDIDMYKSLLKIDKYDHNIKIMPGHGECSILGIELDKLI